MAAPVELTCRDCEAAFTWTPEQQAFYAEKGLQNAPTRCPKCRAGRRQEREMKDALHAERKQARPPRPPMVESAGRDGGRRRRRAVHPDKVGTGAIAAGLVVAGVVVLAVVGAVMLWRSGGKVGGDGPRVRRVPNNHGRILRSRGG